MKRKAARRSADVTFRGRTDTRDVTVTPPAPDEIGPGSADRTSADQTGADRVRVDIVGATKAGAQRVGAGRGTRRWRLRIALVLAWVVLALVPVFVARIYVIPSGSMETTLHGCPGCDNDRVLVDKLAYRFGTPAPGDIVVFTLPDTWTSLELRIPHGDTNPVTEAVAQLGSLVGLHPADGTVYVKRVIALEGQTVACCDERNRVLVDGVALDEPFIHFQPQAGAAQQVEFGPVRIPEGHLWAMGDNRNNSIDSRAEGNGPVPLTDVIGKARFIIYPFDRFGPIPTPPAR